MDDDPRISVRDDSGRRLSVPGTCEDCEDLRTRLALSYKINQGCEMTKRKLLNSVRTLLPDANAYRQMNGLPPLTFDKAGDLVVPRGLDDMSKKKRPNETGIPCSNRPVIGDHERGEALMVTDEIRVYSCLKCGLVFWLPRVMR